MLNRELHEDTFLLHGHKRRLAEEKSRGDLSPSLPKPAAFPARDSPVPAPALAGANPELARGARTHSPSPSVSTEHGGSLGCQGRGTRLMGFA